MDEIKIDLIPLPPDHMDAGELHKMAVERIAGVLGIPAHILNAPSTPSTRAALEQFYTPYHRINIYVVAGTQQEYERFLTRRRIRYAKRLSQGDQVLGIANGVVFFVGAWTENPLEVFTNIGWKAERDKLVIIEDNDNDYWHMYQKGID